MPRTIANLAALSTLVGQELGVSPWRTVSQAMIDQFAELTGDRQWIHLDVERARRESPFGMTIAHGFLTLSLVSSLVDEAYEIGGVRLVVNYGLNRVRFPTPVPAEAQVRLRAELSQLSEIEGGQQMVALLTIEVQGSAKPACVAEWVTRLYIDAA